MEANPLKTQSTDLNPLDALRIGWIARAGGFIKVAQGHASAFGRDNETYHRYMAKAAALQDCARQLEMEQYGLRTAATRYAIVLHRGFIPIKKRLPLSHRDQAGFLRELKQAYPDSLIAVIDATGSEINVWHPNEVDWV